METMLIIGLTGGIGSGKSTVAGLFRSKGIEIIDADLVAREVVDPGEPALDQIAAYFGDSVLDQQGALRRDELRKRVFADSSARVWLEQLLHPLIEQRIRQQLAACQSDYCILMSPLLLETDQRALVDRILVVDVGRETQLQRTLQRDTSSRETIEAIIDVQLSRHDRIELADDVIDNDGEVLDLAHQVDRLHDSYLRMAAASSDSDTGRQ